MASGKKVVSDPDPEHLTPGPQPPALLRVLLVQPEWPARALLKAELEERGCDVLGADSVSLALDLAMRRGFRADVVVVDIMGLPLETSDIRQLRFLVGRAPLLLVRSAHPMDPKVIQLQPAREIKRPVTIGEIADAVLQLTRA